MKKIVIMSALLSAIQGLDAKPLKIFNRLDDAIYVAVYDVQGKQQTRVGEVVTVSAPLGQGVVQRPDKLKGDAVLYVSKKPGVLGNNTFFTYDASRNVNPGWISDDTSFLIYPGDTEGKPDYKSSKIQISPFKESLRDKITDANNKRYKR